MPEMPIDPEFGRFIQGLKTTPDGGAVVELAEEITQVEEMPDGSAVVNLGDQFTGPMESKDFYENLADSYDLTELNSISMRYLDLIKKDKEAREKRDKQYEEGIRRTGLGDDAPGGAQFMGASRVVHPVMAEACVDFAARAIKELFPPDGPARTKILGEVDQTKTEIAERKRDYINWQLTEQIEEFRDEQEQLLTQLPLGGSQYMKLWYDEEKKRPCAEFVPIDNILIPFAAANFYTAQRVSEIQDITEWEFKRRIDRGLYRDIDFVRATMEPVETAAEKATNKIEGKKFEDNEDGLRRVFHIYTYLTLDDDPYSKGQNAPYILMIDDLEHEVIGLYRNWEEGDETMTKLDWLIEFKFIPWRGAYAIGLPHLIGGLSAALTGALRALLDTAHINNSATMLKIKGAKISGQSQQVDVTQVTEIEGAPGVDDIRKIAMPMPFNPPSPVLYQLLGWLTTAAKGVVTTAEEKISDIGQNTPVGTTQALIEQGAAVFSAIHARLHDSQRRVLMVLGRINRWYLDDQRKGDIVEELPVQREDFKRNSDVVPVSDPHIFSETQRISQMQAVLQMASAYPQFFDQRVVVSRMLKQLKVPNVNELMPLAPTTDEISAAEENAAMALGKTAYAYPRQDQIAHIHTHLSFALDPALGSNPIMAKQLIPQVLEHVKQHMVLWYTNRMNGYVPMDQAKYEDMPEVMGVDHQIAMAADNVKAESQQIFGSLMPMLQQLIQMNQQFAQQAMQAPPDAEAQAVLQASLAETQRRATADQADLQFKTQKLQADLQDNMRKDQQKAAEAAARLQADIAMNAENNLTEERIRSAELVLDEQKLRKEQVETAVRLNNEVQRQLGG